MTAEQHTVLDSSYRDHENKLLNYIKSKINSLEESEDDNLTLEELLSDQIEETWDDETKELVNEAIIHAIDQLPEKQKYIFVQQVIEERTFKEIAKELDEPINTVIARKRYAVQFLQRELKEIREIIKD